MKIYITLLVMIIFVTVAGFSIRYSREDIAYPEGYRKWTHIKSSFLGPEHPNVKYRGFNYVYANDKATSGFESGHFPDGSVIVFDVITAVANGNQISEGKRDHIDVMERDSVKFASTGGWNFAQFEADKTPRSISIEVKNKCSACHASQKDHVFSEFRP